MMPFWAMKLPWHLISFQAAIHSIDPTLVASVIMVESSGRPAAIRFEKNFRWTLHIHHFADMNNITHDTELMLQKSSFGLMQVMGAVARELGYQKNLSKLIEPKMGIEYGCKKLRQLFDKHGSKLDDVIASYNAGSPRFDENGEYVNARYVKKVRKYMRELKGE